MPSQVTHEEVKVKARGSGRGVVSGHFNFNRFLNGECWVPANSDKTIR